MSVDFIFRLIGMVAFALFGAELARHLQIFPTDNTIRLSIALSLSFALLGLLVAPWLTTKPFAWVRAEMRRMPASRLMAVILGMTIGLAISALLAVPLSRLPNPFGQFLPLTASFVFGYLGAALMMMRHQDIIALFDFSNRSWTADNASSLSPGSSAILLDSSVIIDGRIADINQTGFVRGNLLVPRFVLNEIQYVADSSDSLRRSRGRRGLEILNQLQQDPLSPLRITDQDFDNIREVDDKLVMLAKRLQCPIMTTDYNLNRVAKLQGVPVLNINELANSLKNVYLPGESMEVRIIQEGSEPGQGVGYLEDGTMVVVQGANRYLNKKIEVDVTKVLQTAAGRMIFAQPVR